MADARRSGMDQASLAELRLTLDAMGAAIVGGEFDGVWPQNWPVVEAFLAVSLQWRVVSRGGGGFATMFGGTQQPSTPLFIGLDYTAVRAGLDAEGIAVTPALWRGLRVMEAEAASELNKADS